MRKLLVLFLLLFCTAMGYGQTRPSLKRTTPNYQDSLIFLGKKMINDTVDTERKNANYAFIKTLVNTLKQPGSFDVKFDSVKSISISASPDNKFRIFSWHVMNDDGSYRFYGTLQMNTGNAPLLMYPLADYTPFIKNPQDTVLNNTQWYGAQYYDIIPVTGEKPYYVLLGWKGNNVKTTKKVIEILSFDNGKAIFGMPVFIAKGKTTDRVVFEYSRQVSMMLKYLPESNTIIFDHLVPPAKGMEGKYDQYGPDLSYDAYKLVGGKWQLKENVDLRNGAGAGDDMVDPRKEAKQDRTSAGARRP